MNPLFFGAAIGATAMYFLDPDGGRRRRARTRDKAQLVARRVNDAYDVTLRDAQHRVRGLQALGQRFMQREDNVPDDKLVGRVRAALGRYVSHPHAIEVRASGGYVTLAGPILKDEVYPLMRAVRHVRGVRDVISRMEPHDTPGNVPSLQGGVPRRGERFELLQDNWAPSARLAVGVIGVSLLLRNGLIGRLAGAALLGRAATNLDFGSLLGLGGAEEGIEVQKTIHVQASVEKVFEFWSRYENFPHFMSRVREVHHAGHRSHWVVRGPAGVDVEWTSEVVRTEPNALIAWRSTPEYSQVKHEGEVRFAPEAGGTRVTVCMSYVPPAGAMGHAVAALLGADPKSDMDEDLMRMKIMIETGHSPHDAAQPR